MNRRTFIIYGGFILAAGGGLSLWQQFNQKEICRVDEDTVQDYGNILTADSFYILHLASLAPSGHNTQPWTVRVTGNNRWIIGTEKARWLPAVDPENRELLLSLGTFLENLIVAAGIKGYEVKTKIKTDDPWDREIMEIELHKITNVIHFNAAEMVLRRTIRDKMMDALLSAADLKEIISDDSDNFTYYPKGSGESKYLLEGTVLANQIQAYRYPAQEELAKWIRWSRREIRQYKNGLTPESMEIQGIARWYVEHFYSDKSVMDTKFRERTIKRVQQQVTEGSGWLVLASKDSSVAELITAGQKLQRLWLKVRAKKIAIHPMTQMLEEEPLCHEIQSALNSNKKIQFVLRIGYVSSYPQPVSPRMPLSKIII